MTNAQLNAVIAAVVAQMTKGTVKTASGAKAKVRKVKAAKAKLSAPEMAAKLEADVIAAFAAKGITDIKPRENVLTFNRWVKLGRKAKAGEKAVKVGPFAFFHESQTEPMQTAA